MEPGIYITRASDADFGQALALVKLGKARIRGEHYLVTGEREIVVEIFGPSYRANQAEEGEEGALQMGAEFFQSAIEDYRNWREGWWREAIQNAVDAGATRIACEVTQQADGSFLVSCDDNGAGMDKDTLRNVFMRLKGTAKKGAATTGGFGEAKRLLVLPWVFYEMHTRDVVMRGSGGAYKTFPAPLRQGTRLTVTMPADSATTADAAMAYIAKCHLPGVRLTVNGQSVKGNLAVGEKIRDLEQIASLFYDKRPAKFEGLVVRIHDPSRGSLAMFTKYVTSDVKGQLILEIYARSTEVLTSNRDGFRGEWSSPGRKLEQAIDAYVSELAADTSSALKKKAGLIKEKFLGTGKFETRQREADLLSALGQLEATGKAVGKGAHELAPEQLATIAEFMTAQESAATTTFVDEAGRPIGGIRATAEVAEVMLEGLAVRGGQHFEAIVAQLAWEPDFYLVNEVEGYKVPKKYYPQHMTSNIRKLLRCWAELCRFVLIQLGSNEKFGVGFIIDESTAAAYQQDDGHWLMLNPFVKVNPLINDEIFSISDWDELMWLYAAAVHECTHMADGIDYHNESFAAALTRNFAKTSGKDKQIRAIKRITLAEEKKVKERLPRRPRAGRSPGESGGREVSNARFFETEVRKVDGPVYRGSLKGVIVVNQDTGRLAYEFINLDSGLIFRREVGDGAQLAGLEQILKSAYSAQDVDMELTEHADVYTRMPDDGNAPEVDRWRA